ncbi:MAG TPA: hypothetical protein VKB65_02055, partial [Myxococcota bacterium]|nr:hypothetical protein [Myxococcota bacterium]
MRLRIVPIAPRLVAVPRVVARLLLPLVLAIAAPAGATSVADACLVSPTPEHCCHAGQTLVLGTPGPDLFVPRPRPKALCVFAGGGDDQVLLGRGSDFTAAGPGRDFVLGGPGAEQILGEGGDDWLLGGPGPDAIVPGPGSDVVFAGPGPDRVVVNDLCEVPGDELLVGGPGWDELSIPVPPHDAWAAGLHFFGFEHLAVEPRACFAECVEAPDCSGRGSCVEGDAPGEVACACEPGFAGEHCEWCIGADDFACPSFDVEVSRSPAGTELSSIETAPARTIVATDAPPAAAPALGLGVADAIDDAADDDLLAVALSVRAGSHVPSLPRLRTDLDRSDPVNLGLKGLRQDVQADFETARFAEMSWAVGAIEDAGGAVRSQQALGAVLVADVPAATLGALTADTRVARIVLLDTELEPPSVDIGACGDVGTDVGCGSADHEAAGDECTPVHITDHAVALRLNQLRQAGYGASGFVVGVIDTGASEHDMLEGTVIAHHACNVVQAECQDEGPFDWQEGTGHGTATHSVIAGNTALGNLDRGITLARTESWRAYKLVSNGGPKGIAGALAAGNEVLLLEVQTIDGGTTAMEEPAEEAFDAGAVVVGVAGNGHDYGPCALPMGPLALVPNMITT